MNDRFAAAVGPWQARLGKLRDVVRQELVARQLDEHLGAGPLRVLDAGCGQGSQALRLARLGHQVTGLDSSDALLERLQRDLAAESQQVQERTRVVQCDIESMADLFEPASFDVVLCHGVLMYVDDPDIILRAIAPTLQLDGLVSLLVRNGDALGMRPGLLGDWATALAAFDSTSYLNRIGVVARADRLETLTVLLTRRGFLTRQWYGVRVFTDTAANDAMPPSGDDLTRLLACEERAARTDPYRAVAPLLHIVASRTQPSGAAAGM